MPPPKQRTPELGDRILSAAIGVLAEDGVAGLTARRVAREARTSPPAVYELFGDKGGLVRAIFFEGFRMLFRRLEGAVTADGPEALRQIALELRSFIGDNAELARVMFERPFADFDPGPQDLAAGAAVREFITGRVARCAESGVIAADPTDASHVLIGLVLGLAAQESAGWLGRSAASADRRWALGIEVLLGGLGRPLPP